MDANTFGRIAAQSAKQVIIQKMKDAEKKAVYSSFIDRKGEIINGIVQRIDRRDIIVNIGNAEAILPAREQIPREAYAGVTGSGQISLRFCPRPEVRRLFFQERILTFLSICLKQKFRK